MKNVLNHVLSLVYNGGGIAQVKDGFLGFYWVLRNMLCHYWHRAMGFKNRCMIPVPSE